MQLLEIPLAKTWPDADTPGRLAERAVQDDDGSTRGAALLAKRASVDAMVAFLQAKAHSRVGEILFTKHLDGRTLFSTTKNPSPVTVSTRRHKNRHRLRDINAVLASLSAHLGWNILRGSRPNEE